MLHSLEQSNATSTHKMSGPFWFLIDILTDWSDPGSMTTLAEHRTIEHFTDDYGAVHQVITK
jgi:hypothetical protein